MNIQKVSRCICLISFFVSALVLMIGITATEANINQTKLYKKAFPGTKPKCLFCHVAKIPKKADGKHDFNIYGAKVKATAEVPTEETYKEVGSTEDFEASSEEANVESQNSETKKEEE